MKNDYNNSIRSVRHATAILIACLVMLFSAKSTASTTVADSLNRLVPKPIRLTEAGARQVLRDKADLIMLQGVVKSQDTLLLQQRQALSSQSQTIRQLSAQQQQAQNVGQTAQAQANDCRKKLCGARLENWLTRAAVLLYIAAKFKLI